jgi:hypothetical protein
MSLRTAMLQVEDTLTNLLLPSILDQVPHQVTIITRTWTGGEVGADGGFTDSALVMPKKFPIRQLTTNEVSGSGGNYEMGDIIVELIVPNDPANPGVGYTVAQLAPHGLADGTEVIYQLTGQHAGNYKRVELRTADAYEYKLVLRRDETQPEVVTP